MDDSRSRIEQLTPLQRATLAIGKLRARLDAVERARLEPIAIVGIGCRIPGAAEPRAFWRLLRAGQDLTREVPATRWNAEALYDPDPDAPGKAYTKRGGFIEDVEYFDADFFNLSPREAAAMDPQQRLLLEVSWEALEDAGVAPGDLAGSSTGTFIGLAGNDYVLMNAGDPTRVEPYLGTGNGACFAAGRLSYLLGLQGPSLTLDTACSSSLVAAHLACGSLRAMECDLAIAGGVQLMLTPDTTVFLCRTRALAPDGRCKSFDAAADGYARSEGCGVVVLKRLSDAERDGDHIYAVIRGSAVNHDGPSGGLTVPNGLAQQRLVQQALKNAGVQPADIHYVEAHGTGTSLGDPIEVEALGAVLAEGRAPDRPLWLGSVKTNIGHLEAAAGVAGLIKLALALEHGELPPHLHFRTPNPHIDWARLPVRVSSELMNWPHAPERRVAGLSAFGLSGTNAHMVLSAAEPRASVEREAQGWQLLCLSAKSDAALTALAERWLERLGEGVSLADACATAWVARSHFSKRLAVVGDSREGLIAALTAHVAGHASPDCVLGETPLKSRVDEALRSKLEAAFAALPAAGAGRRESLLELARLYTQGAHFEWSRVDPSWTKTRVRIPTYPFQRERHLTARASERQAEQCAGHGARPTPVAVADLPAPAAARERVLAQAGRERKLRALLREVETQVRAVLGYAGNRAVDARTGFSDLGMDSIMMVELGRRLQVELGCELPATVAFDYPSVEVLTQRLAELMFAELGVEKPKARAKTSVDEPIAIVGMACRVPGGANSPRAYWELLRHGRSGIAEVPPDRWAIDEVFDPDPDAPGKMYTRCGGFLQGVGVEQFDAQFFGISPREALSMDPQQRLLLECAWEALEHAGQPVLELEGSRTGVFVGISSNDYGQSLPQGDAVDPYCGTGNAASVAAGRVAYVLGFQGPTLALDTSCSSSLVSIHLACQSLRSGESNLALAGGVNLMLSPAATIYFCKLRALARDGHCKTFDAAADGYARGEGCALVVLKRLSDAVAAGDDIWAVVRGSAVNHDGRSSGLTVPNGPAQRKVIESALESARIAPAEVSYVEAHGTGTPLGDPIELDALASVFAPGRLREQPLLVGSVKTNVGHLEAAAGVTGVIKVALAMRARQIPEHVGLKTLNPHLSLADGRIEIVSSSREWVSPGRPRIAGVSSFGISGTNAHVILAEAPPSSAPSPAAEADARSFHLLLLSARTPAALTAMAAEYRAFLEQSASHCALADICHTALVRRSHLEQRVALVAKSKSELCALLQRFEAGERRSSPALYASEAPARQRKVAFVFSGVGSQWSGMGQGWLATVPAFREALARVDAAIRRAGDFSVAEILASGDAERLDAPEFGEPCIFAIQVALAELWSRVGLLPDAVVGHSLGEVAAAHVAGALDLDDAARLVVLRSRLRQRTAERSGMAALGLGEEALKPWLLESAELCLAAVNAPRSVVVAGELTALERLVSALQSRNVFARLVKTRVASHSPAMDAIRGELEQELSGLAPRATSAVFYSSVNGAAAGGPELDAGYWGRNLRHPVQFAAAVAAMARDGYDVFLELGPHPVLGQAMEQTLESEKAQAEVLSSSRRDAESDAAILGTFGALHVLGQRLDGTSLGLASGRMVDLPTYPWQRRRYWQQASRPVTSPAPDPLGDWLYETSWIEKTAPEATRSAGHWLIVGHGRGLADELARALKERGHRVTLVRLERGFARHSDGSFSVAADEVEHYARVLADAQGRAEAFRGIVHVANLDATPSPELDFEGLNGDQRRGTLSAFCLAQALTRLGGSARLWFVTRGAQPVGDETVELSQAPVWGLGRVIALENPDGWGGLIDLAPRQSGDLESDAACVISELESSDGEDQVAYRASQRRVARLQRVAAPARAPLELDGDGTYLVTGGLGALGLQVAEWLVERGARHLVLLGRKGLGAAEADEASAGGGQDAARDRIAKLEARGVRVRVVAADVADPTRMREVFGELAAAPAPLRGLIHAAGVSIPRSIAEMELACFEAVLRAKIAGTWLLHELTRELELKLVVYFSSLAATLGSALLAPYAAGNHFLDAVARFRQAGGLEACSINWGGWAGEGMTNAEAKSYFEQMGLGVIPAAPAFDALARLSASGRAQTVVAEIDWARYKPVFEARRRRPLIDGFEAGSSGADAGNSELLERIARSSPQRALALIREFVRDEVGAVLGLEAGSFEAGDGFFQLGMDSLMSVSLRGRLERAFGRAFPATVAFEHPSVLRLSDFIAAEVCEVADASVPPPSEDSDEPESDDALDVLSEVELAALLAAELSPAPEERGKP